MIRAVLALIALGATVLIIVDCRHASVGDPRRLSRRAAWVAFIVAILSTCAMTAHARPSPFPPVTQYDGDRISARQAQMGTDVAKAVRIKRSKAHRKHYRDRHPFRVQRPVVRQIALTEGMTREVRFATGGRPRAWCGWWLGHHLGVPYRHLWIARNWAKIGSNAGGPGIGMIVVWAHHVGIITGRQGSQWVVKSGNDGGRVRERARSVSGAIAFRNPHGNS